MEDKRPTLQEKYPFFHKFLQISDSGIISGEEARQHIIFTFLITLEKDENISSLCLKNVIAPLKKFEIYDAEEELEALCSVSAEDLNCIEKSYLNQGKTYRISQPCKDSNGKFLMKESIMLAIPGTYEDWEFDEIGHAFAKLESNPQYADVTSDTLILWSLKIKKFKVIVEFQEKTSAPSLFLGKSTNLPKNIIIKALSNSYKYKGR